MKTAILLLLLVICFSSCVLIKIKTKNPRQPRPHKENSTTKEMVDAAERTVNRY